MDISYQFSKHPHSDGSRPLASITIYLDPGDDPDGHIAGLVMRERLAAFLRVYARPADLGAPADAGEARELLQRFAYVTQLSAGRLDALELAARDQFGLGWGTIATAEDRPRASTRARIIATRRQLARLGVWFDSRGLQRGTPEQAHAAAEDAE